jgi:hypothetical protein
MTDKAKKKLSPAQLAALAAGRAKAKANKELAPKPVLEFVQTTPEVKPQAGLDHAAARAKLKQLGLANQRLPGRKQVMVIAGHRISNEKGVFYFSSAEKEAPSGGAGKKEEVPAKREPTREDILAALAWLKAKDFKLN